jgi:glucokinase
MPLADPTPRSPLFAGADIGGTKIGTVLLDADGAIVEEHRHPTEADEGAVAVLDRIARCFTECFTAYRTRIAKLGIGVAGQVDAETGAVLFAPNLEWTDVPVAEHLQAALGLPVVVTNDVRAATWGEWAVGAGRGADDLVVVFVGTGVGGGIVSGGQLLTGASNTFGELGHVPVTVGGRPCRCGGVGCVEAYAGGWAIGDRARELVSDDPAAGAELIRLAGTIEDITAATVTAAYRGGDAMARALVENVALHLATAATGYVNALNPERLILGGGVVDGLPELVATVEATVRRQSLHAATEHLVVRKAALGSLAPAIGAAALARATSLSE